MGLAETREIKLTNGNILTVEIYPGFYDRVRARFQLLPNEPVHDDYVRMFLFSEVKSAVDNAGSNVGQ